LTGVMYLFFFFQAEDGIRDFHVTGVQTCALPIYSMICELAASDDHELQKHSLNLSSDGVPSMQWKVNGQLKKTYRMALACTGEYAVAVAGANPTKADVLSAMVTTMNRVNGIYER